MTYPHPAGSTLRPGMPVAVLLVIASLYFGKDVLMPLALAVLLSFVLAPIMTLLESLRFGRIPAVLTVVVLAFALLGALGWVVLGNFTTKASSGCCGHGRNCRRSDAWRWLRREFHVQVVEQELEIVVGLGVAGQDQPTAIQVGIQTSII